MRKKTLKSQIKDCLKTYPETRNSDIELTKKVWIIFYKEYFEPMTGKLVIDINNLYNLPSQDGIKRIRAHFQNDKHLYLPTDPEIAKRRGWEEEEWRKLLGYNPELKTVNEPVMFDEKKSLITPKKQDPLFNFKKQY